MPLRALQASLFAAALLLTACGQPTLDTSDSQAASTTQPSPGLAARAKKGAHQVKELLGQLLVPATSAFTLLQEDKQNEGTLKGGFVKALRWTSVEDLLDELVVQLGSSGAGEVRAKIRAIGAQLDALTKRDAEIREALLTAKSEEQQGVVDGFLKSSREDLEAELSDNGAQRDRLRARAAEARGRFVQEMRLLGLQFDDDKAQNLLATATGDDFVQLCVVVDTMRDVVVQLQDLASTSDSGEAAQRYYGVYIVLLKAIEQLHQDFVARIDDTLIPQLDQLARRAEDLIGQIDDVIAQGGDVALGRNNQKANRLTIRATGVYKTFLKQQAADVRQRLAALSVSLADAETTYATMEVSNEVTAMIRQGLQILQSLDQLQLPPLMGFENQDLRQELDRLTLHLNQG
jgi:hypothetical protein